MPGTVFLSYSRDDSLYVARLADHLAAAGLDVWYDYEIRPGERFGQKIRDAIDSAAVVVPVLTPAAVRSAWVEREISYADQHAKPLVPLLLVDCAKPIELTAVQHHDVRGGRMPTQSFIDVLRASCGPGPAAPPPEEAQPDAAQPDDSPGVAVPEDNRVRVPAGRPIAMIIRTRRRPIVAALIVAVVIAGGIVATTKLIGGATSSGARVTAVLRIQLLTGGAPTSLDRPSQVIRHRLTTAGFGHPDVAITGADQLTVSVDDTGNSDELRALLAPGELRFRKVLAQAHSSAATAATPGSATASSVGSSTGQGSGLSAAVAQKLGPTAVETAGQIVAASPRPDPSDIAQSAATMAALEPFRTLTPDEVATVPVDMQFLVPQIACAALNARPQNSIVDEAQRVVACDGSDTKMLLSRATVDGSDLASATARSASDAGGWSVDVIFTNTGAPKWTALSAEVYNNGACDATSSSCQLAIVLDNHVVTAPTIEGVLSGEVVISGSFDQASATLLANQLASGALDVGVTFVSVTRTPPATTS